MGPTKLTDGEIMVWRRTFAGLAEEACKARQFVAFLLAGFPKADDAVETAAELFNNGVRYSRSGLDSGRIVVEVRCWPTRCVTVAVTDGGGENEPVVREASVIDLEDVDALAEGGRGLIIVGELADCWGWTGDVNGRTVTAIFTG
jgi:serine/threonine-protein kinase RsbW